MKSAARDRFILSATAGYTVFALAWIFLSDQLLAAFTDIDAIVWLSTAKGVFFVIATAALFFLALRAVPSANPADKDSATEMLAAAAPPAKWPRGLTYAFAVVITLAMLLVRDGIAVSYGDQPMLILFMLPIILSALLGGLGPGLVSTALAALGVDYLGISPIHSFRIASSADLLQWGFLIGNGVAVSLLSEGLRKSLAKGEMNRRLLSAVISGTSDAVFVKDAQGRYLLANAAAGEFVGKRVDEIAGRDDYFLFPADSAREVMATDLAIMAAGQTRTLEERVTTHDGKELTFLVTKGPVLDASGRVVGLFGISREITERKRAEAALRASESALNAAQRSAGIGSWTWDLRSGKQTWSEQIYRIYGRDPALPPATETELRRYFTDEGWASLAAALTRTLTDGAPYECDVEVLRPDGGRRWISARGEAMRDAADGSVVALHGTVQDITERKQAELDLHIAAAAFESQESMVITDARQVILRVNRAFTESTGYTAAEVVGRTPSLLKSSRHDADFYRGMWDSIKRTGSWQGEIWDRRKNGEEYPKWLTISAVKGGDGAISHYVGTHLDISERKRAEEKIRELAFYDPLTALPNRALLLDRMKHAMTASVRNGLHGALLFIDLDNFKVLNDTLGHQMGDLLLKQVAVRLTTCVREGDTVARLGGDEFVVLLDALSASEREAAMAAEAVSRKILGTLDQSYALGELAHRSTASIGVTLFLGHGTAIDTLLKQADLSMYRSKEAGRNTVHFFEPAMESALLASAALEGDLRQAIEKEQFLLHYQAQVVSDSRLTGAEVLLRWQHPTRGIVSPADFIPLAEATGLILPLGDWVLATACRQLASWAARPGMNHLTIAVNVSARQFRQNDFVDRVLAVLRETGANPHRLKLELTESVLVSNVEETIEKMFALKAKGVGFSLDDFGTGYSSLSYLKRLPLDQLKIDQSFVRDVLVDANDAAIARTIVALAESLGLGVIAEGVESATQMEFLASAGCHAYQGYFFSRPLPLEAFEEFARRAPVA